MLARNTQIALLALVAGSIVSTEVLLTRLLSVATYYGLAFVVLSLAMLGLAAGALDAARAERENVPLREFVTRRLLQLAVAIVGVTVVITVMPVVFAPTLTSFASIIVLALAASAPLGFGSSIVARILASANASLPVLYAVDLGAAALGALAPLALLGPLSAPGALVATAALLGGAAALLSARDSNVSRRTMALAFVLASLVVLLVTEATPNGLVVEYPKGERRSKAPPIHESWNALAHVELHPFVPRSTTSMLWAPSPKAPKHVLNGAYATIDGDAGTLLFAYTSLEELELLKYDATASAHRLRPNGTACVIGVGGGRDILSALVFGHSRVFGVEINPGILAMHWDAVDRSPLLRDPRVEIVLGDGRAELARPGRSCSVIQATLVDTWAATNAGAFAHTEATIYTLEAWRIFLRRVEPDGIVTFSRWHAPGKIEEAARLVALATASLLDRGITKPRDHIALVIAGRTATILVSPAPFTPADRDVIRTLESELEFQVALSPDTPRTGSLLDQITDAPSVDTLSARGAPLGLDTSAPTDDRPFFFQLRTASAWLHPLDVLKSATTGGVIAGNAVAMFQLLVAFLAVTVVGAALLGPTLLRAARAKTPALPGRRAALYFAALGAGFMLVEVALVQRMHVVLGHPTYALVAVLAALLLATGIGSALSPRVLRTRRSVAVAAAIAALLVTLLPYVLIRPLAARTLESALVTRVAWSAACSMLVGVNLGMLFPAGLRFVSRAQGTPLALAINGFTSILGSTVAIVVSVWADIPTTFVVAGAVYAVAAVSAPPWWRAPSGSLPSD